MLITSKSDMRAMEMCLKIIDMTYKIMHCIS